MTVSFRDVAKMVLVSLYSGCRRYDSASLVGASLAAKNRVIEAITWLIKKRLVQKNTGDLCITAKGQHYVEKKGLLHNPLYALPTMEDER